MDKTLANKYWIQGFWIATIMTNAIWITGMMLW